eukprot:jgi/Ulvmu1/8723/UM047_0064.1
MISFNAPFTNSAGRSRAATLRASARHGVPQSSSSSARAPPAATGAERAALQDEVDAAHGHRRSMLFMAAAAPLAAMLTGIPAPPPARAATLRAPTAAEQSAFEGAMDALFAENGDPNPGRYTPILLRIAFHDAGTWTVRDRTGGANGSIQFELGGSPNNSVVRRFGWPIVLQIKRSLAGTAAANFSLADVIALAPAYGLSKMGGGAYPMKVGRVDASSADAGVQDELPRAADSIEELKASFARKGLNARDLVALSGSHTIGRIPGVGGNVFDNSYYQAVLSFQAGLGSDRELLEDPETRAIFEDYANNNQRFLDDFRDAYTRLMGFGYA